MTFAAIQFERFDDAAFSAASLACDFGPEPTAFELPLEDAVIDPEPDQSGGYDEGLAAGEAAAAARFADREQAFIGAVTAVQTALAGFDEAVERAAVQLVERLLRAAMPGLARAGLAHEVAAALADAARAAPSMLEIAAPADQAEALRTALSEHRTITVREDADLVAASARIITGEGGVDIDVEGALSRMLSVIVKANAQSSSGIRS